MASPNAPKLPCLCGTEYLLGTEALSGHAPNCPRALPPEVIERMEREADWLRKVMLEEQRPLAEFLGLDKPDG